MDITAAQARKMVEQYIRGWVEGDEGMICAPLSESCLVIESHGPTYNGIGEIRQWIRDWTRSNKVNTWELRSFIFADGTASCEWVFSCAGAGTMEQIYGASFLKFKAGKISSICEYRITNLPERWLELFKQLR